LEHLNVNYFELQSYSWEYLPGAEAFTGRGHLPVKAALEAALSS